MNYVEYGKVNRDVIVLLHGGGLSWWNYREVAEMLSSDYHVILPILDGHANSKRDFTTIEANAEHIIDFINEQFEGSVLLIGGVSLGGQILLEILSQKNDICKYAIIESALVIPSKITNALIKPVFGSSYGLIRQKWFSKLQFKELKIKNELFEDYYRDTCSISKANMISFLQANTSYYLKGDLRNCTARVHIYVGERENKSIHKSAKVIKKILKESSIQIFSKLYHGEFSINHAKEYADAIHKIAIRN